MSSIFNLYKLWSHSCMQYFYISNLYNSLYIVKITRIEKFKIIEEDILFFVVFAFLSIFTHAEICRSREKTRE